MDLVGQLLEYTPTRRLAPLDACVHPYFDELRQPTTRLPNGKPLPPMFNFSAAGSLFILPLAFVTVFEYFWSCVNKNLHNILSGMYVSLKIRYMLLYLYCRLSKAGFL